MLPDPRPALARVPGLAHFVLLVGVALGACALAALVLHRQQTHDVEVRRLVRVIAQSKAASAQDSARLGTARLVTDQQAGTLHRAVARYDAVRPTLVLHPLTAADTAHDIARLPALVAAADSLRHAALHFALAAGAERQRADSLDHDRQVTTREQDTLITRLEHRPRLGGALSLLYDPMAHVSAIAVDVTVRVAGPWALGARGEQRVALGERPRFYVLVQRSF
jgi:hypothetical protein